MGLPHVLQSNGDTRVKYQLPVESHRALPHRFGRMDGVRLFAYAMWPIPPGFEFADGRYDSSRSEVFIQCAGSAGRLAVELREQVGDELVHWVLADPSVEAGACDQRVEWDAFGMDVHANEVFDSVSAAALFDEYYETGTVDDRWKHRVLFRDPAPGE